MTFRYFTFGVIAACLLAGCGEADVSAKSPASAKPMRVVSLDFCADQYVLKMVDRDRILAVSKDADKAFSYMRKQAIGLPTVRSVAEDVLVLKPDLVVRAYGGGPNAASFFERAGIPVLNVGWAGDIEGINRVTQEMADGLGVPEKGQVIVAEMNARLAALPKDIEPKQALYMTPSGTTSGSGSMVQEMFNLAGLENFQRKSGWHSLPLERLAYEQPEMIAAAFFDTNSVERDSWSAMRHPIARAQIEKLPTVPLNGSWMSCSGWFTLDAVEALANRHYSDGTL